jgi:hypothetical protein
MTFARAAFAFSLVAALCAGAAVDTPRAAHAIIQKLDQDKDYTLDLNELRAAGEAVFDRFDTDKDGLLEPKELGIRLPRREFDEADADHDGTLTREEFQALVEKRFHAADADGDQQISEKETHAPAGRALLRLVH